MTGVCTADRLFSATSKNNSANSAKNDTKIKPRRPILDIVDVESATLFETDIATTRDLGEAGKT